MTRLIWLVLNLLSIIVTILLSIGVIIKKSVLPTLIRPDSRQVNGMERKMVRNGTQKMPKNHGAGQFKKMSSVSAAGRHISLIERVVTALTVVYKSLLIELRNTMRIGNASFVDYLLVSGSLNKPEHVQKVVVQNLDGEVDVYTLSLDKHHVYIANGILVANCYIMRMYFVIRGKMTPGQSPEAKERQQKVAQLFLKSNGVSNSAK